MSRLVSTARHFPGLLVAIWMLVVAGPLSAALNSQEQELANRVIGDAGQARAFVTIDATLSAVARAKAMDMAKREYFSHTDPDGHGANYLVRKAGYALPSNYSTANDGNNIESLAAGYVTVSDVWQGWMGSSSHKTHILGLTSFFASQTSLGVGYYQDSESPYRYYWVIITAPPYGPTLAITTPVANASLTTPAVTVAGTTGGNPEADRVEVRVENSAGTSSYAVASGRTSWSTTVNGLATGTNTVRVRSLNASGVKLMELTRVVKVVILDTLNVSLSGSGKVTTGFVGATQRELDRSYSVTATPATGWLFANWSGGVNSPKAALSFKMSPGLSLTANFVPNPFIPRKGTYNGLLASDPFSHETSGFVQATVTSTGGITGSVRLGALSYSFNTQLDLAGNVTITLKRGALAPLTLALHLDVTGDSGQISGTLSDGVFTSELTADRAWQTGEPAHAFTGRYTVVLPGVSGIDWAPAGSGYATLVVSGRGAGTLSATLADGTAFSAAATVSKNGVMPLFKLLYSSKGSINGSLRFRATSTTDLDGNYHWTKPDRPTIKQYPAAFSIWNPIVGSCYVAPTSGQTVVAVPTGAGNVQVGLSGGNLDPAVTQTGTLSTANRLSFVTPQLKSLAGSIAVADGRFSGSFIDPVTKATRRFYGAFLQKQNAGFGYFLGTDKSGIVTITPTN
jgi:hypothetical protein